MRLMINPQATPTAYHSPIPVPLHWQDEVKADLDRDVRLGVLEPVPIGEPVTWCHRMVICAKKNGKPRRTIDFQPLNAHATRETHHTQSPFHQARSVPQEKKKTVFDAWNGYHSVPLHPEDRHYTTFITPWGRYRYRTAPQGYIASGDGYTRRYDEITASIPNKTKCVDDTLLWSDSIEESFFQACNWLDICGKHGITLNPEKFRFAKDVVEFAGFEITNDTVRPCKKYIRAISEFPTPQNLTDVRSWFGLVNQVSYAFSMADIMLPFRELLKPSNKFTWDDTLQQAFEKSKLTIIDEIHSGVKIFDKTKPTCLATDWSKTGIGYWLFQKHCSCPSNDLFCCKQGWKITLVGSRFTHAAESRYAPIEGEALAVADALDKARHFVLGCNNLTIAVDHRPLLKIFGDRSLDQICNTRLRKKKKPSDTTSKWLTFLASKTEPRTPSLDIPLATTNHPKWSSMMTSTVSRISLSPLPSTSPCNSWLAPVQMTSYSPLKWKTNYGNPSSPPCSPHKPSITGNTSKSPHHLMTTCSYFSLQSRMASPNLNINYHHPSENTTNLGDICTAAMASSSTRTESSSHPPYDHRACLLYMLPTRAYLL